MAEVPRDQNLPLANEPAHETSDAEIRPLAIFLAGLTLSLIVVSAIVWLFFDVMWATINRPTTDSKPPEWAAKEPKEPLLQVSPQGDLVELRAKEQQTLSSTEWVDRSTGRVRIPIEKAMEIAAARGLPKWPPVVEEKQPPMPQNQSNTNK